MPDQLPVRFEEPIPDYHIRTGFYLKAGWELFKQNALGYVGFSVVLILVLIALNKLPGLGQVLVTVLVTPLSGGLIVVALKSLQQQPIDINDFGKGFAYFLPLMLYGVVSGVIISLGFVLLIIPGIYFAVGYLFPAWLIIDRRMDFWPAMELSRKTMQKRFFEVFGFSLILLLINFGGLLLLGLGFFVTLPYTFCVLTVAYRDIFGIHAQVY